MERRKFVIGAGALASGSAAAMGTGAFSQVVADRDADLAIEGDDDGYLRLNPVDSDYASLGGDGTLELDFDEENDAGGTGINNRADTVFEDVFSIENQGTENVWVWAGFTGPDGTAIDPTSGGARSVELLVDDSDGENLDITYPGGLDKSDEPETSRSLGQTENAGAIELAPGDSKDVEIRFLVYGSGDPRDSDFRIVFNADAGEKPTTQGEWTVGANGEP